MMGNHLKAYASLIIVTLIVLSMVPLPTHSVKLVAALPDHDNFETALEITITPYSENHTLAKDENNDYYKIKLYDGDIINITMRPEAGENIDLYFYGPDKQLIKSSTKTGDATESLSHKVTQDNTYYIRVARADVVKSVKYELIVSVSPTKIKVKGSLSPFVLRELLENWGVDVPSEEELKNTLLGIGTQDNYISIVDNILGPDWENETIIDKETRENFLESVKIAYLAALRSVLKSVLDNEVIYTLDTVDNTITFDLPTKATLSRDISCHLRWSISFTYALETMLARIIKEHPNYTIPKGARASFDGKANLNEFLKSIYFSLSVNARVYIRKGVNSAGYEGKYEDYISAYGPLVTYTYDNYTSDTLSIASEVAVTDISPGNSVIIGIATEGGTIQLADASGVALSSGNIEASQNIRDDITKTLEAHLGGGKRTKLIKGVDYIIFEKPAPIPFCICKGYKDLYCGKEFTAELDCPLVPPVSDWQAAWNDLYMHIKLYHGDELIRHGDFASVTDISQVGPKLQEVVDALYNHVHAGTVDFIDGSIDLTAYTLAGMIVDRLGDKAAKETSELIDSFLSSLSQTLTNTKDNWSTAVEKHQAESAMLSRWNTANFGVFNKCNLVPCPSSEYNKLVTADKALNDTAEILKTDYPISTLNSMFDTLINDLKVTPIKDKLTRTFPVLINNYTFVIDNAENAMSLARSALDDWQSAMNALIENVDLLGLKVRIDNTKTDGTGNWIRGINDGWWERYYAALREFEESDSAVKIPPLPFGDDDPAGLVVVAETLWTEENSAADDLINSMSKLVNWVKEGTESLLVPDAVSSYAYIRNDIEPDTATAWAHIEEAYSITENAYNSMVSVYNKKKNSIENMVNNVKNEMGSDSPYYKTIKAIFDSAVSYRENAATESALGLKFKNEVLALEKLLETKGWVEDPEGQVVKELEKLKAKIDFATATLSLADNLDLENNFKDPYDFNTLCSMRDNAQAIYDIIKGYVDTGTVQQNLINIMSNLLPEANSLIDKALGVIEHTPGVLEAYGAYLTELITNVKAKYSGPNGLKQIVEDENIDWSSFGIDKNQLDNIANSIETIISSIDNEYKGENLKYRWATVDGLLSLGYDTIVSIRENIILAGEYVDNLASLLLPLFEASLTKKEVPRPAGTTITVNDEVPIVTHVFVQNPWKYIFTGYKLKASIPTDAKNISAYLVTENGDVLIDNVTFDPTKTDNNLMLITTLSPATVTHVKICYDAVAVSGPSSVTFTQQVSEVVPSKMVPFEGSATLTAKVPLFTEEVVWKINPPSQTFSDPAVFATVETTRDDGDVNEVTLDETGALEIRFYWKGISVSQQTGLSGLDNIINSIIPIYPWPETPDYDTKVTISYSDLPVEKSYGTDFSLTKTTEGNWIVVTPIIVQNHSGLQYSNVKIEEKIPALVDNITVLPKGTEPAVEPAITNAVDYTTVTFTFDIPAGATYNYNLRYRLTDPIEAYSQFRKVIMADYTSKKDKLEQLNLPPTNKNWSILEEAWNNIVVADSYTIYTIESVPDQPEPVITIYEDNFKAAFGKLQTAQRLLGQIDPELIAIQEATYLRLLELLTNTIKDTTDIITAIQKTGLFSKAKATLETGKKTAETQRTNAINKHDINISDANIILRNAYTDLMKSRDTAKTQISQQWSSVIDNLVTNRKNLEKRICRLKQLPTSVSIGDTLFPIGPVDVDVDMTAIKENILYVDTIKLSKGVTQAMQSISDILSAINTASTKIATSEAQVAPTLKDAFDTAYNTLDLRISAVNTLISQLEQAITLTITDARVIKEATKLGITPRLTVTSSTLEARKASRDILSGQLTDIDTIRTSMRTSTNEMIVELFITNLSKLNFEQDMSLLETSLSKDDSACKADVAEAIESARANAALASGKDKMLIENWITYAEKERNDMRYLNAIYYATAAANYQYSRPTPPTGEVTPNYALIIATVLGVGVIGIAVVLHILKTKKGIGPGFPVGSILRKIPRPKKKPKVTEKIEETAKEKVSKEKTEPEKPEEEKIEEEFEGLDEL